MQKDSVRPLLCKALASIEKKQSAYAVDFGVGSGTETAYLLDQGYNVIAIDNFKEFLDELLLHTQNQVHKNHLQIIESNFEDLDWQKLPQIDLFVALYSLFYCKPDKFHDVWRSLVSTIAPGGYFVGHIATELLVAEQKDGYFLSEPYKQSFLTKKEIQELFVDFAILYFDDAKSLYPETSEEDTSQEKIYSIIAQKKSAQ